MRSNLRDAIEPLRQSRRPESKQRRSTLFGMTARQRRRARRRGGARTKILFVFAAALALLGVLAVGVASWVLDVAAKAPPLSACRPIDRGGNSVLFAGDGSRLGYIAS